ncbi:tyrosine-type recombinase/integrase [Hydromonas duriensis]|uniref:Integrase n=1 Tax=Hydromonas duriensis TaxID=1527608 RepID=A0A4R6Y425_9BURK|nr:integrase arm-type DNA-binding domain-containing protein [Hydromonas duriensis]TDR27844.1 integrase [Hydromonas duriensis]
MKQLLNDTAIKNAKPSDKTVKLTDGGGLSLFIEPNGSKRWRYRYKYNGKEQMLSLGIYPAVSLKEARIARDKARELLDQGTNPSTERRQQKQNAIIAQTNTFKAVALLWFERWQKGRDSTYADRAMRQLEKDIFPSIGHKPINDVTTLNIVHLVEGVAKRGALNMAEKAYVKCGQVFDYALTFGYATQNPARMVKLSDIITVPPAINQARIKIGEMPKLLQDIDTYNGNALTRLALRLMSLTFVRTKELIETPWSEIPPYILDTPLSEIDYNNAVWEIPKERMKLPRPHIVPLSRQTVQLLKELHKLSGHNEYLFPSQNLRGKTMSNNTILYALYRMGYHSRMTGHGFRGVASTFLKSDYVLTHVINSMGEKETLEVLRFNPDAVELQLAHVPRSQVEGAYDHSEHLPIRIKMMQYWADYLGKLQKQGETITAKV